MVKAVIFDMYETLITQHAAPLYFGAQMAEDIGMNKDDFYEIWRGKGDDYTLGKITLEELVSLIMHENDCYSEDIYTKVIDKRIETKQASFSHLHTGVIPMLEQLKKRDIKIGLISNCYSEEAIVIRESELFRFFDVAILSCEHGVKKPDKEIFKRCLSKLNLAPEECLYVGDGGCEELDAAKRMQMKPLQAIWYLKENYEYQMDRLEEFEQLNSPKDLFGYI